MKTFKLSLLALSLTALAGCKAIEAMDNTETMKTDLAAMKATTGGMADTTNGMKATTEELKRKASVGEGLKLIDAPENQKEFAPPSKGLLAGAKLIAENMTTEELVKFFQAGLKEIRKTGPNEVEMAADGTYPARYVAEFNRHKDVQVVTLQAIAAQIPQAVIEKIVQEQLQGGGGAQSDETRDLLMLRAMFINNFFLSESVFATGKKLDNVGKLKNAMNYARQLKFVAELAKSLGQKDVDLVKKEVADEVARACDGNKEDGTPKCSDQEKVAMADSLTKEAVNKEPITLIVRDIYMPVGSTAKEYNDMLDVKVATPWFDKIAKRIDRDMPESLRGGASPYAYEIAAIKEECRREAPEQK